MRRFEFICTDFLRTSAFVLLILIAGFVADHTQPSATVMEPAYARSPSQCIL